MKVRLNEDDCDLGLTLGRLSVDPHSLFTDSDGYNLCPLTTGGFVWLWSGVRANVCLNKGKYFYEAKITENLQEGWEDLSSSGRDETHFARFGWSTSQSMVSELGNARNSFGFGSAGMVSRNGQYVFYRVQRLMYQVHSVWSNVVCW